MTALPEFIAAARRRGALVVQPRMGLSDPAGMGAGLRAVRAARATTVGTITLDSFTRVGQYASAHRAVAEGTGLNGYPLLAHGPDVTRAMLDGLHDAGFPVQVRHGAALAADIVATMIAAGLDCTEGGPVSYCLPYGRTPLRRSVPDWARCCELLAATGSAHLESFGGCLLGQLCPPSLLVAVTVLEGVFFRRHGLRSVSLSYAQQTHAGQDLEAIRALRTLAGEFLGDLDRHVVLYTYMGVFPRSRAGAEELLRSSARLARWSGAERLIVKTVAESSRIPTVGENVEALQIAEETARRPGDPPEATDTGVLAEARRLVEAVLDLDEDVGRALVAAFERGVLDVPYCLHPDNANRARAAIAPDGRLVWSSVGAMPIAGLTETAPDAVTADGLLGMLGHVRERYDRASVAGAAVALPPNGGTRPS